MDGHEAFERVRTARAFAITDPTQGGKFTLQERAFFHVLNGPQAAAKFGVLVGKGTLAGRMYGLLGLKITAPPAFAKALPKFLRSWRKVPVATGSRKTKDVWARTVAAQIRDGDYGEYLKGN